MIKQPGKFKDLVAEVLADNDWSQKDLAKKLGVTEVTLSRWVTEEYEPPLEEIVKVKRFKKSNLVKMPVLGSIPNGEEDKIGELEISPWVIGGNWEDCYALKLHGRIPIPEYQDAEFIIVRKGTKQVFRGDCVVVKLDGVYTLTRIMDQKISEMEIAGVVIWVFNKP